MRLFQRRHRGLTRRIARLEELQDLLGEDHDLEVLRETIAGTPERFGKARMTAITIGCIDKSQRSLRMRALKIGRRLFRHKPRKFYGLISAW